MAVARRRSSGVGASRARKRWLPSSREPSPTTSLSSASLSAKWRYSAVAVTPTRSATARMVTASGPRSKYSARAAPTMRLLMSSLMVYRCKLHRRWRQCSFREIVCGGHGEFTAVNKLHPAGWFVDLRMQVAGGPAGRLRAESAARVGESPPCARMEDVEALLAGQESPPGQRQD